MPHLFEKLKALSPALFAATLLLSGCGQQGGWQMPPPVVETVPAARQAWAISYSTTGTLEANNKVDLNVEAPGTITQINVSEGDYVHRGQTLIRMEADEQHAQVQQAAAGISTSRATLEQQRADIRQAQARLESAALRKNQAQSELQRFEKLYQEQFISQLELDQRRNTYDTALVAYQEAAQALSSARARQSQAAAGLAQARSAYRYNVAVASESVLRAPFSGVVGQRYVDPGDYVAPTEKILTLVDPSLFKMQFSVPERYLGQVASGQPVTVTFEALGDAAFGGRVNFIDPVVDPESHTVLVKAIVPATKGLKHGLFGNVNLTLGTITNAVVIPEEAIVPQGEKTFVYVVKRQVLKPAAGAPDQKDKKDDKKGKLTMVANLREVIVGHRNAGRVQVQSGLAAGEQIIVGGLQKVSDNQEVMLKSTMSGLNKADGKGR